MSLKLLNQKRTVNYVIMLVLLIIFTFSLYSINFIYPKDPEKKQEIEQSPTMMKVRKVGRFVIPLVTLLSFFAACVVVAYIIADGGSDLLKNPRDQYAGIYFLLIAGVILTVMNFTVLKERSIKEYIKGKKFSVIGAFMALGVSAIVFGFLDNFGMKLGTEALDDTFVQLFLGPFSSHKKFEDYKENIAENLQLINNWSNGSWRTVMNHLLRCKDDIAKLAKTSKLSDNRLNDLMDDLNTFVQEGGKPLNIPKELFEKSDDKDGGGVREYVRNIRAKYDMIDGSKSMMGNTFSDFIGAILGAAIINLFTYMTSYDGISTGDDKIDNSFLIRNLNKLGPFMEALFISLGCLIPIFLNIAITRDSMNNNNKRAWTVVAVVGIIMVVMMYFSVFGTKNMKVQDKKRSINKTIGDLQDRLAIGENDGDLKVVIEEFLAKVNGN
jgi:hypothetical protein